MLAPIASDSGTELHNDGAITTRRRTFTVRTTSRPTQTTRCCAAFNQCDRHRPTNVAECLLKTTCYFSQLCIVFPIDKTPPYFQLCRSIIQTACGSGRQLHPDTCTFPRLSSAVADLSPLSSLRCRVLSLLLPHALLSPSLSLSHQ